MLVDLPLHELLSYAGRNPKPADFDSYWEESLAEMRAVDPSVRLDPVDLPSRFADCYDLWFTGVGGAKVYAKLLAPKARQEPGPALVCFHGYSMSSSQWTSYLHWVAQGFTVAALDCRGQGGKSEDPGGVRGNTLHGHIIRGLEGEPKDLLFRSIFLDCAQLAGIVMGLDWVDERRVGASGGSQGGALSVACAALEPRVAKLAPEYPFLSDYKRVWEMDLAKDAYDELRSWFRRFDPRHERESWVWERLGYIDPASGTQGPGRDAVVRGADGHRVPAFDAVRRLQQAGRTQELRAVSGLRA